MTDQVQSPEAGAQPQDTTSEVENLGTEALELEQGAEQQEQEQEQRQQAQKVVPLAALHEERAKLKELRERTRVMEERFSQLQNVVSQRLAPPQQEQRQQVEVPDVNADPVGHFRALNEQLRQQLEQVGRPVQEIQQRMAQQEQYQQLQHHVGAQISEFSQEKPDIHEAIRHAQTADMRALMAMGYDQATAQQMVVRQYDDLTVQMVRQNRNVAEGMYAMAQAKGYQGKQQQSGAEQLQGLKKGVAAARSLGSGSGVTGKLSLEALAAMPAEDFAKAVSDADFRKLMGG